MKNSDMDFHSWCGPLPKANWAIYIYIYIYIGFDQQICRSQLEVNLAPMHIILDDDLCTKMILEVNLAPMHIILEVNLAPMHIIFWYMESYPKFMRLILDLRQRETGSREELGHGFSLLVRAFAKGQLDYI